MLRWTLIDTTFRMFRIYILQDMGNSQYVMAKFIALASSGFFVQFSSSELTNAFPLAILTFPESTLIKRRGTKRRGQYRAC
jgi:hypothetical protein